MPLFLYGKRARTAYEWALDVQRCADDITHNPDCNRRELSTFAHPFPLGRPPRFRGTFTLMIPPPCSWSWNRHIRWRSSGPPEQAQTRREKGRRGRSSRLEGVSNIPSQFGPDEVSTTLLEHH